MASTRSSSKDNNNSNNRSENSNSNNKANKSQCAILEKQWAVLQGFDGVLDLRVAVIGELVQHLCRTSVAGGLRYISCELACSGLRTSIVAITIDELLKGLRPDTAKFVEVSAVVWDTSVAPAATAQFQSFQRFRIHPSGSGESCYSQQLQYFEKSASASFLFASLEASS